MQGFTKGIPIDIDSTMSANSDGLVPSQKAVKSYVDNGLATKQNTLTGSESVLVPNRLLFKQNTTISHTGITAETIIYSVLIPAGTFQANDIFSFNIMFGTNTNNANAKTARVYFNTTNSLSGATLSATRTMVSVVNGNALRNLVFKNSLSSQDISSVTTNIVSDESSSNINLSALTINFAVDQYFIISAQLGVGTDTMGIRYLTSKITR